MGEKSKVNKVDKKYLKAFLSILLSHGIRFIFAYKKLEAIGKFKLLMKSLYRSTKRKFTRHQEKKETNRYAEKCFKPIRKSRKTHRKKRNGFSMFTRPILSENKTGSKKGNTYIQGTMFPVPSKEHRKQCVIK